VINDTNDTIVAAVQVPGLVVKMIPSEENQFIYMLSLNETGFNGNLSTGIYGKLPFTILNTKTNKITATFLVGAPGKFEPTVSHVFLDPNGNIYLNGINQTYIFNTSTNMFTGDIPVNSSGITGSPDGKYVYMTSLSGQTLYIINALTNKIVGQVQFKNPSVINIAVSPNNKYLYVSRWNQNDMTILNATSGSVVKNIKINNPFGVSPSPNPKYIYIWPGSNTSAAFVLNTITNNEVAHFVIHLSTLSLTIDPFYYQNGNYSYDISQDNKIYVYDSNPNHIFFLALLNYIIALLNLMLIAFLSAMILRQKKKFS